MLGPEGATVSPVYLIPFQVNNAGATQLKTIPDLTSEDLDEMMDLHVKGPFNITQRALPAIIKTKGETVCQYYQKFKYLLRLISRMWPYLIFTSSTFPGTIIFVSSLYQLKPVSIIKDICVLE